MPPLKIRVQSYLFFWTCANKTVESLQQLYFCKQMERALLPAPKLVVVWENPHTMDL